MLCTFVHWALYVGIDTTWFDYIFIYIYIYIANSNQLSTKEKFTIVLRKKLKFILHEKAEKFFSHTESTAFVRHSSEYETSDNNPKASRNIYQMRIDSRYTSASGIYFGSPLGCYPTFHTLTSVGRKQYFQYVKRIFPLFRAIVKFCSTNRLFT